MALQNLNYLEILPMANSTTGTSSILLCDAAGEKVAMVFKVRKTGTIDRISVPMRTVTVSDTLKISLQTVDGTNGEPSGSLYGSSGSQTFTPANVQQQIVTLATPATATAGDLVAVVVEFNSYVAGNLNFAYLTLGGKFPYMVHNTGTWGKLSGMPAFGIGYSDGSYENIGTWPGLDATNVNTIGFNSGSTPDERALRFSLPFTARLQGTSIIATTTAGGNIDVILYDVDGSTVLTSQAVVANQMVSTAINRFYVTFPTSVTLLKNSFYRLAVRPSTANNITTQELVFGNAASMDSVAGGQNFHLSTRTDGGAWTQTATTRPRYSLIFDKFDDGSGNSATVFHQIE